MQMIPMPFAPSTSLCAIVAHRHLAHGDRRARRADHVVVHDVDHRRVGRRSPRARRTIVQPSTMLIGVRSSRRCRCPVVAARGGDDRAVADHHAAVARGCRRASRRSTRTWSSIDVVGVLDVDAVLAADDGDVAQRHVVGPDDDAAADDARPTSVWACGSRAGPGRRRAGERSAGDGAGGAEAADEQARRSRRDDDADAAELAAGLAVLEPQAGRARGRAAARPAQPSDEEAERRPERRRHLERMPCRRARARARRAAPRATPAGIEQRGGRRPVERDADREHQRRRARSPTSGAARARASSAGASTASRDSMRPLSVYDIPGARKARAAYFGTGDRVGGGERPLAGDAGERERARLVGQRGDGRVGGEHDPALVGLERRERRPGPKATCPAASRAGTRSHRSPARPRSTVSETRNGTRPGPLERLVPLAAGRVGRLRRSRSSAARSSGAGAWNPARPRFEKSGRGALSGRRAARGGGRRPPRAGSERVQPFRRGRHAGADDRHPSRVLVRLVRVHTASRSRRTREPGMPVARARARKGPSPSSSKPPFDRAALCATRR